MIKTKQLEIILKAMAFLRVVKQEMTIAQVDCITTKQFGNISDLNYHLSYPSVISFRLSSPCLLRYYVFTQKENIS
jgi:hypothetical protein